MKVNEQNLIESCHDVSDGGMISALSECLIGTGFGAEIDISGFDDLHLNAVLFSESHSRFVVSIKYENKEKFDKLFGSDAVFIGKVNLNKKFIVIQNRKKIIDLKIEKLQEAWDEGLK